MELLQAKKLNKTQQKMVKLSKFLGKLILAGLFFRGILHLNPSTIAIQEGLAKVVSIILSLFGYQTVTDNISVIMGQNSYIITQDCLGWKSVAAFLGLSFASYKQIGKLKLVALGVVIIFSANLVRIVSTIMLSQAGWVSFDFIHNILWRWGLTVVVFTVWISTIRFLKIKAKINEIRQKFFHLNKISTA